MFFFNWWAVSICSNIRLQLNNMYEITNWKWIKNVKDEGNINMVKRYISMLHRGDIAR